MFLTTFLSEAVNGCNSRPFLGASTLDGSWFHAELALISVDAPRFAPDSGEDITSGLPIKFIDTSGYDGIDLPPVGRLNSVQLDDEGFGDSVPDSIHFGRYFSYGSEGSLIYTEDGNPNTGEQEGIWVGGSVVTDREVKSWDPEFSPGEEKIVFVANHAGTQDLFVLVLDGLSVPVKLTNSDAEEREPTWSPDGEHIAYVRDDNIWVIAPDGSNNEQLSW